MAATMWRRATQGSLRVWRWCGTAEGRRSCLLLALALLVRLALAPYHGFFGDLEVYTSWGLHLGDHFLDFYSFNAAGSYVYHASGPERGWMYDMPANYPPLSIYVFYAQVRLYALLAGLAGHGVAAGSLSAVGALCMKIATLAADLGTGALIYLLARRARGPRWALLAPCYSTPRAPQANWAHPTSCRCGLPPAARPCHNSARTAAAAHDRARDTIRIHPRALHAAPCVPRDLCG